MAASGAHLHDLTLRIALTAFSALVPLPPAPQFDLIGRLAAAMLPPPSPRPLLALAGARAALPLALLSCNIAPLEGRWAFPGLLASYDIAAPMLLALLALTNGAATALVMTGGPACAPRVRRGAAATQLTACLVGGITAGSALSVLLTLVLHRKG